jgi:CheY-like chemotaxis protein
MLENIIYVDDEEDIREVALIALEDIGGFSVKAFASAMALLQALPPPPDLILLDVMMPGMDGPALLRELRKKPGFASIPAIFMTAKVQPSEVQALLAEGAVGVVAKPFDPMSLAPEIVRLWEKAKG